MDDWKEKMNLKLFRFCAYGSAEKIKKLIEKGASPRYKFSWEKTTPLHRAVSYDNLEVVKVLCDFTKCVSARNKNDETAFYLALRQERREIVEYLISEHCKAYVDFYHTPKTIVLALETPLMLAIKKSYKDVALFLAGKVPNMGVCDNFGNTALHFCAGEGKEDMVDVARKLLIRGASIDVKNKDYSFTPLHLAVERNNFPVAKVLVEFGANLHTRDKYDTTPLHSAVTLGNIECVRLLMENFADPFLEDKYGHTAIDLASCSLTEKAKKLLPVLASCDTLQSRCAAMIRKKELSTSSLPEAVRKRFRLPYVNKPLDRREERVKRARRCKRCKR